MSLWSRLAYAWRQPEPEPPLPVKHRPAPPTPPDAFRPPPLPVEHQRRKLHAINTKVLVDRFVDWMRETGCYGYWLCEEVDEYLSAFCDQNGWVVPHPYDARSHLVEVPGVSKGRWSIKTAPEFYEVRIRTSLVRPTLYRISREKPQCRGVNDGVWMESADVESLSRLHRDAIPGGVRQPSKRKPNKKLNGVRRQVA